MKNFFAIMMSLFFIQGCTAQSQLPKELPENLSISLHEGGGMTPSYKKITIENNVLEFEELISHEQKKIKWSAQLSAAETAQLYRVFVENKFDTIKNDERKGIVYDAGSENISITYGEFKTFHISYGKNSPLSGKNLERYLAVQKAINGLTVKSQNRESDDPSNQNLTLKEAEKFIQGKWRTAGENGGHAWFLEWTFEQGKFTQLGYPPITQDGKYKLVSLDGNKLKLELYDQKGTFGEEKRELEIILDKKSDQLSISNMKGFLRINN